MAKHGSIGEYKPESDDWTAYAEQVGHYFTENDIIDKGKKRAIFLSVWSVNLWTHLQYGCS